MSRVNEMTRNDLEKRVQGEGKLIKEINSAENRKRMEARRKIEALRDQRELMQGLEL